MAPRGARRRIALGPGPRSAGNTGDRPVPHAVGAAVQVVGQPGKK